MNVLTWFLFILFISCMYILNEMINYYKDLMNKKYNFDRYNELIKIKNKTLQEKVELVSLIDSLRQNPLNKLFYNFFPVLIFALLMLVIDNVYILILSIFPIVMFVSYWEINNFSIEFVLTCLKSSFLLGLVLLIFKSDFYILGYQINMFYFLIGLLIFFIIIGKIKQKMCKR
jgi:hypothetical protein